MSRRRRLAMVNRGHPGLSVVKQCRLLQLSRSAVYYRPTPANPADLDLMAGMDRQYLKTPYYGSRRMTAWLRTQGHQVNRKRVRRLMRAMGLEAIYRKPNTSKPAPEHRIYPYLLKGVAVDRVNQVWAADITYLPMSRGFLYLVAIMDWHSRYVLAWRLSNTLEVGFCIDALKEALSKGQPEIFNTDQGSQFTSEAFCGLLLLRGIKVSMDGKGRYLDNIFVERLWRSVKYEEVYLKAYRNGSEARRGIDAYLDLYNRERPHQALGYRTPAQVFAEGRPLRCLPEQASTLSSCEECQTFQRESLLTWPLRCPNCGAPSQNCRGATTYRAHCLCSSSRLIGTRRRFPNILYCLLVQEPGTASQSFGRWLTRYGVFGYFDGVEGIGELV